jgi:hypothetical protein
VCPGLPKRLPGTHWGGNHFLVAPSSSRGGTKDEMVILGTYCCARAKSFQEIASATELSSPGM